MKKRTLFVTSAVVFSMFVAAEAQAAGTAVDVNDARATGMASAVIANVDDSSGVFFNPAGIARGKGVIDARIGGTAIVPSFNYRSPSGNKTWVDFYIVPPPHVYFAYGITDWLTVGIGEFSPYGLRIKWPSDWDGRRLNQDVKLYTYYFNPTVTFRYGPVRIGGGFQLVRGTVELQRAISFGSSEGQIHLGAGAWGVGGNGGIQVDAIKQYLTLGFTYRSAVKLNFNDGNAHFSGVPIGFQSTLHDQKASTSLTQPDTFGVGVASRPIKRLLIEGDIVWYNWSQFRSIDINFPDDPTGTLSTHQATNWNNKVNYHLGGEGEIDDHWRVRAGALLDPSPAPKETLSPIIPDATRLNLAIGAGYVHELGFRVDAGYQFLVLFRKDTTFPAFPGDYGGFANLLGVTVGYQTPMEKKTEPSVPAVEPPPAAPTEPAPTPSGEPPPAGQVPGTTPIEPTTPPAPPTPPTRTTPNP
ncbi:membrane protein involved in aromatic hydrocarbon degradation [Labilithrix luteola]|uniref:Membrane protein involved in aromatic hydrocarbon degradation n=1 Tax=Labilithrix luteola TaxID=1391654 RepID=A0A0K1Q0E0_9BACT|nr:outer membrane protein transport protein [Labilithrix luteola]AKU98879.1 membrane protein involved in aromatic hydrocarbon degradation [Labilithrix luteola]